MMKSDFLFWIDKGVSVISNVPTHPNSIRKKWFRVNSSSSLLWELKNRLISEFFLYRSLLNQVFRWIMQVYISHRIYFETSRTSSSFQTIELGHINCESYSDCSAAESQESSVGSVHNVKSFGKCWSLHWRQVFRSSKILCCNNKLFW